MEPLPDFATLSDAELRTLIDELVEEENQISYRRRLLQGRIDILKAERTARLQKQVAAGETNFADVDRLTDILSKKAAPPNRPESE